MEEFEKSKNRSDSFGFVRLERLVERHNIFLVVGMFWIISFILVATGYLIFEPVIIRTYDICEKQCFEAGQFPCECEIRIEEVSTTPLWYSIFSSIGFFLSVIYLFVIDYVRNKIK